MKQNYYISVVIPVEEINDKLFKCLNYLYKNNNNFHKFETIIVCQTRNYYQINKIYKTYINLQIINIKQKNLCTAYNIGAKISKGNIVAFLSDDCYPRQNWLKEINNSFKNRSHVCITGNTLPYIYSQPNDSYSCLCTFFEIRKKIISKPCYHATNIGFSNNFAIKKEYFIKIGGFREIFSPGAIGIHAADADLFLRILIDKKTIIHNPDIIVWHDHWLNKKDEFQKQLQYIGGEVACYGLYALKGHKVGYKVLYKNFIVITLRHLMVIMNHAYKLEMIEVVKKTRILCIESKMRLTALYRAFILRLYNN